MQIQLLNIVPEPLADNPIGKNSVWNSEVEINSHQKIILNAVSGKGKSTLISFLSGVRHDYKGDILFDKTSIKTLSLTDWITLRQTTISTIYQDLKLFDNLTVEENIILKNKLTHHFSDEKIKDYIIKAGLKNEINKKAGYLSYGQKQRVAIIRALAQPFKLLLLDEPFSHLDFDNQNIMIEMIENEIKLNNAGFILTSLNNTHSINYEKELFL